MKKLLALITAILLLHTILHADPISPKPLRKLILETELIVHAKVIEVGKESIPGSIHDIDYALLEIVEVIQGKVNLDTLKVQFYSNLISPAPPVYKLDEEDHCFPGPTQQEEQLL